MSSFGNELQKTSLGGNSFLELFKGIHIFILVNYFLCHQSEVFFLLIWCESWWLVRVVSIVLMDLHDFTLFFTFYRFIGVWLFWLINVKIL